MKKSKIFLWQGGWGLLLVVLLLAACKKDDHFKGGSPTNDHTDLTTYDYLKANPLFDTLILLIDKAGLKETLNSDITFVAPTDYSIKQFLNARTVELQKKLNDENVRYTIDSLKAPELRDSLMAYMYDGKIQRADLSLEQQVYKNKVGEDFSIRLKKTDQYGGILSAGVQYIYVAKIINGIDPDPLPDDFPQEDRDIEDLLQTTGIITKTGILHVLANTHAFYWK